VAIAGAFSMDLSARVPLRGSRYLHVYYGHVRTLVPLRVQEEVLTCCCLGSSVALVLAVLIIRSCA
jgi:hypothetical protein